MYAHQDHYGFDLATSNADAAAAYDAGGRSFVAWRADAIGHLNAAMDADPEFALPKILKAWILHAARTAKYDPAIDALITAAEPLLDDAPDRDRVLMKGLKAAHDGNLQAGAAALEAHLATDPMDLLSHRIFQFELFWCGQSKWMRDVAERAAPAWTDDSPDYSHFLAVRAFSNEEAGNYDAAEHAGRSAVEREPENAWGAHAVAHVLLMTGRAEDGRDWMEGLSGNWQRINQIGHHNWWHLCLFLLETGEHERILDLIRRQIRNPASPLVQAVPDATIDIQNVASLLQRLELRGVDVGDHWSDIAEICAGRTRDHANPFSSAHDAMVLAATGQFARIEDLIQSMTENGIHHGTVGHATAALGIPLVRAMAAHRKGQYAEVVDLIWPIRRDLYQIGGSHAQRDIFYQVLTDAALKADRRAALDILLDDVSGIGFWKVNERTLYRDAARVGA